MAGNGKKTVCYEKISTLERLKIYFYCLFYAIYYLLKRFAQKLWKTDKSLSKIRDKPPSYLVDNTLGRHWYVKIKSLKLHYVQSGEDDLPLIILLHGFPDFWFGWRHQIKFLSEHFQVVAVDLKGFGDSDKPVSRLNYNIKFLMNELLELVVSFKCSSKIIIGHDLGAYLGWYFATIHPEQITKFVSISCPHPNVFWDYMSVPFRLNSKWIKFCQMPVLPELEAGEQNLTIIDDFYGHLKVAKEENLIEAYKYVFSRPEDWTGPINYYRNLPFYRISKSQSKIKVPTLIIVGNCDPLVPLESVMTSTDFISVYTLKIVKGAAHFPHQEHPEYVNNLLLQFLKVPKKEIEPTNYRKSLMNSLYDGIGWALGTNDILRLSHSSRPKGMFPIPLEVIGLSICYLLVIHMFLYFILYN